MNGSDGENPASPVTVDAAGNLYGEAAGGVNGDGIVYELTPGAGGNWTQKTVFDFDQANGAGPIGGVVLDAAAPFFIISMRSNSLSVFGVAA